MNFLKTTLLLFFALIGVVLANPQQASADTQSIRISPVIINLSLSPGKSTSHSATIENLTDTPLPLKAVMNDFSVSGEDGGYSFVETGNNPFLSWVSVNEKDSILKPREKKKITITIKTPDAIALGGYYGLLFFEPVQPHSTSATMVNTKIGILLLANIGVPDPNARKAEIVQFSHPQITFDGSLPISLRVKNVSLNFISAKPSITLTPLIGVSSVMQPKYLEEKIIFPDKIRRWLDTQSINGLQPNIYQTTIALSTGNGRQETQISYTIVLPPVTTLLLLLTPILVLFLIFIRKRLKNAFKEIFR